MSSLRRGPERQAQAWCGTQRIGGVCFGKEIELENMGLVRHGCGIVRRGSARSGSVRYGDRIRTYGLGAAILGKVRRGSARCGSVRCGNRIRK